MRVVFTFGELRTQLGLDTLRLPHYALLLLCALLGAGGNVYRGAHWLMHDYVRFSGFDETVDESGGSRRWARPFATVRVSSTVWRPLTVTLRLCGPPERGQDALRLKIETSYEPLLELAVPAGCSTRTLPAHDFPRGEVVFELHSDTGGRSRGVGVAEVHVAPQYTAAAVAQYLVVGALFGMLVWALVLMPARRALTRPTAGDRATTEPAGAPVAPRPRAALVLFAIVAYLSVWAVLKPPLQSPDEVQQILRAQSVPSQPWASGVSQMRPAPRFANPLALRAPGQLGKLFFEPDEHLSRDDIAALEAIRWPLPAGEPVYVDSALATYPTGYYAPLFLLGESTTALLRLTPYQATYAYRAWSLLAASVLWVVVYRALLTLPDVGRKASLVVTFLLLNPMLAFVSSSASPDAVNVPLGTLAIVLIYKALVTGRNGGAACLALVACGLTKPSAAPLSGGLILATLALSGHVAPVLRRLSIPPLPRLTPGLVIVARALVLLLLVYYAWSSLRFQSGTPLYFDAMHYLRSLVQRKLFFWTTYWGRLGWLDYQLPRVWYLAFAPIVFINIVCAWFTLEHGRRFAAFAALVFLGYFLAMCLGEFAYLPMAGFNLHGRHLLPACIGLAGLVLHRVRWARWSVIGYLALMNVALMQMSVVRYFGGDWYAVWLSLP